MGNCPITDGFKDTVQSMLKYRWKGAGHLVKIPRSLKDASQTYFSRIGQGKKDSHLFYKTWCN